MMRFFVLISSLFLISCGRAPTVSAIYQNYLATQDIKKQNPSAAQEILVRELGKDSFRSEMHLNLGLTYAQLEQAENALKSYKNAEKNATTALMKFMALFNQAELQGRAKQYDEALKLYQAALALNPTSKEVKTNIELLIQQQQQQQKQDKGDQGQQNDQQQQQNKNDQNKDQKDQQNQKDQKDKEDQSKEKENKKYSQTPKYQPRPFNSKDLDEGDVKKILGELKQQEQKIRAEFNRKESKEQPRDKDW